jgi:hypothetical protein
MTLLVESDHLVEETDVDLLDRGMTKVAHPFWWVLDLLSSKVVDNGRRDRIAPDRSVWLVLVEQICLQPLHVQLSLGVFVLDTHSYRFGEVFVCVLW